MQYQNTGSSFYLTSIFCHFLSAHSCIEVASSADHPNVQQYSGRYLSDTVRILYTIYGAMLHKDTKRIVPVAKLGTMTINKACGDYALSHCYVVFWG
jgi:hypothetical protein